jgi:hypothetical protein
MSPRYHRFPPWRNGFYASNKSHPANVPETFASALSVRNYVSKLARQDCYVKNGVPRPTPAP